MVLAEALLRVPDAATADRLIEDKLAAGDWSDAEHSDSFLVSASAWTLGLTARSSIRARRRRHCREHGQAARPANGAAGDPPGDEAAGLAFCVGADIEEALSRAGSHREFRYSFDMLGEGAHRG